VTRSRTLRASAAAVLAGLLLSACGTHPGSAAVVGSDRISNAELDDVASALCSAQTSGNTGGQQQDLASRAARQGALDVLISAELSRQFARSQGVEADQEQVSQALAANEQNISGLPASQRAVFRDTLRKFAEGQLMLVEIGRRSLTRSGAENVTDQQALSEGMRLRNAWVRKNVDVSVDPRYGEFAKGSLVAKSGSLSVPVSQRAADGNSPNPSAGWVAALPASQKCR
jgi:hypothetical protein